MTDRENDEILKHLYDAQRLRNELISQGSVHLTAPPVCHLDENAGHVWQTTTAPDTVVRSAAADECITLCVSPFQGRRSTILFLPLDRPWDGDPCSKEKRAYVSPSPLPFAVPVSSAARRMVERRGPYATLSFVMPTAAVRFSGVMCTLERAGFTEETSLLSTSWSLKWCKRPVRSDFLRLKHYQHINHFPGTWRIGKKDELHKHLMAARERWIEWEHHQHINNNSRPPPEDNIGDQGFGDFFPEGWVLPDEYEALYRLLRSDEERGNMFITKPATGACGRGIHLLTASKKLQLTDIWNQDVACNINRGNDTSNMNSNESVSPPSRRVLVQRYVPDPLLIEGYKFDLRLYVVVTSYAPLRAYLYDEGLVRFATSPYPSIWEKLAGTTVACDTELTAHLTNFTINKKSEDFVPPGTLPSKTHGEVPNASKWTLSALQKYFHSCGFDWGGTMMLIDDMLLKILLSVMPHVVEELNNIDTNGDGIGHGCFEVYGVDVLLRQPHLPSESIPTPVIMEVNIMPSLSTHYSLLDQCVKGNFIADMLTLVGITAAVASKRHGKHAVPTLKPLHSDASPITYEHAFLDALTDANELEACLTAEEEFVRRTHFRRFCPTPQSYGRYHALFRSGEATTMSSGAPRRSLNQVLSAWEQAKLDNPPPWA